MQSSQIEIKYSVWLITHPLCYASSDGKSYLSDWGVLVSPLTLIDTKVILHRTVRCWGTEAPDLGTIYELYSDCSKNTVNIQPFELSVVVNEWHEFSADYIGETKLTQDMIMSEGKFKERFVEPGLMRCDISDSHQWKALLQTLWEKFPKICYSFARMDVSVDGNPRHNSRRLGKMAVLSDSGLS